MGTTQNADQIIASTGLTREGLDAEVAEWRGMSLRMESVLADHFPVDEISSAVDQLAHRLSVIAEFAHTLQEPHRTQLQSLVCPSAFDAEAVVADQYNPAGRTSFTSVARTIYGYAELRFVMHAALDMENHERPRSYRAFYVVSRSGHWVQVGEAESVPEACERLLGSIR